MNKKIFQDIVKNTKEGETFSLELSQGFWLYYNQDSGFWTEFTEIQEVGHDIDDILKLLS